ncbi:MAG: phosphate ABC transporter substrate-binding protein PstS, partial [Pyrinomonadaceae bacterium]
MQISFSKIFNRAMLTLLLICAFVFASACSEGIGTGGGGGSLPGAGGAISLQGAGATFPNPLYQKWLSEYSKAHSNIRIDYQSIGSGGGIKQFQQGTIDFGASDAPMNEAEMKASPAEVVHIPTALGAVVITYNLQGVSQPLKFSSETLADIFLGKIKKWDDAKIKQDNAGVNLPSADITVVHRSDGSGTTYVFTDYLAKVSPEWKEKVGTDKSPQWPAGQGGKGNEGVTGMIKQQPNTIGYVELAYAMQSKLPVAQIKNASGKFVDPSIDAVTAAAAASASSIPDDLRVSIVNAQGETAYPISSFTYILIYKDQKDATKGKALVDFLWWGIHDGEQFAKALQYAP